MNRKKESSIFPVRMILQLSAVRHRNTVCMSLSVLVRMYVRSGRWGTSLVAVEEKDIALRTLDPYYMERVGIFMKEVGKQLAPLQVNKGGNIIMVQVENEYGSYGIDKPYVSAVRDLVRESGFPMYLCFNVTGAVTSPITRSMT